VVDELLLEEPPLPPPPHAVSANEIANGSASFREVCVSDMCEPLSLLLLAGILVELNFITEIHQRVNSLDKWLSIRLRAVYSGQKRAA
jgi:hypothetical protein